LSVDWVVLATVFKARVRKTIHYDDCWFSILSRWAVASLPSGSFCIPRLPRIRYRADSPGWIHAGAIAVASHASGMSPEVALDASIRISQLADPFFVARGQLLPSLHNEINTLLSPDAHLRLNSREGMVGLAYREIFPRNRSILKTHFDSQDSLIDAICDSSIFPYFTLNRPFRAY
jgi:hypothetical protein